MDLYKISIPDFSESPYIIKQEILNNKSYYFEYLWNVRHKKAYLSIYKLENDVKIYLIRLRHLTNGLEISEYITDENWSGNLYFLTDKLDLFDYSESEIAENFYILYRFGDLEVIE